MTAKAPQIRSNHETGFSLIELLIATAITLVVLVAATTLLAATLRTRSRENKRSDGLAATQRALNMMSREIANTGYGLYDNGIVDDDSGQATIRVRANLNNDSDLTGVDEDIRYVYQAANKAIVRFDPNAGPEGGTTVMATNINSMALTYWDAAGLQIIDPANYHDAERITIDVGVNLPADASQPASSVRLVSDVSLRNAPKTLDQF
jgi:prepilin-type N-terminal cleavage/methylation domain-containing protein